MVMFLLLLLFKLVRSLYRFIYNVACENSRLSSLLAPRR